MAETYCNSYYAATRNQIAPFPRLDKRIEVDVAIIGGGFTVWRQPWNSPNAASRWHC